MLLAAIPIFYQLIEAYHPAASYSPPAISVVVSITPTPSPVLAVKTATLEAPKDIGGDGQVVNIAVLGDSMIQTLGEGLPALKNSLHQYFPNHVFNLQNFGQGSQTIEYGLNTLLPEIISQKPDIIVVESFAYNNFGNTENGINRHWLALGAITTKIKTQLPNTKVVIAATIAPNSVVFGNGIKDIHFTALEKLEKASTTKLYLQNTINFATSQGFPLADAYHLSLFGNEGSNDFINSGDNLHPSTLGATLFSDLIADTISKSKLLN